MDRWAEADHSEQFWLQKFTRRSDKSVWSKITRCAIPSLTCSVQGFLAQLGRVLRSKIEDQTRCEPLCVLGKTAVRSYLWPTTKRKLELLTAASRQRLIRGCTNFDDGKRPCSRSAAEPAMKLRRFVCRESSILRSDGGCVMTKRPPRLEARTNAAQSNSLCADPCPLCLQEQPNYCSAAK